jgi:hypothetical protein
MAAAYRVDRHVHDKPLHQIISAIRLFIVDYITKQFQSHKSSQFCSGWRAKPRFSTPS